ncbi:putative calcium binding hemolysin protein [Richelia sinica FACHB-800]|uniref:Calcium binding hemolysin protein n=1 Tax=Richelia sinica FACHB-800 TaxID=1357546 RepID=A0A975T8I4_9NOST|nr:putative calcium binding hemolysin protein [Richelia sinica FACHB-800]
MSFSILIESSLSLVHNQLSAFSRADNFWQAFDTAFGTQYNHSAAETLRSQWQAGDFSQIPQIEILDSTILGHANGAYASSTNQIYLSNSFLATATSATLTQLLLEEIGHFVDAQINLIDSAGDEGAIFAELVQGYNLDSGTLQSLKNEDDSATITVDGQTLQVEQQTGTSSNDNLTGSSDNDIIQGLNGNDTLSGQGGNDQLFGGLGNDILTGGTGNDQFVLEYFDDSTITFNQDLVTDFVKGQDKIDLSNIGISDYNTILLLTNEDIESDAVITTYYSHSNSGNYSMEQPGSRHSNPASTKILSNPSASASCLTRSEPGTTKAFTPSATLRPLAIFAASRRSVMRPLVQLPIKQTSIFVPLIG